MRGFASFALSATAIVMASNLWCASARQPEKKVEVKPLQSFRGELAIAKLELLPKDTRNLPAGYINDEKTFQALWEAWQPDKKLPAIDFKLHFVVYVRNVKYINGLEFDGKYGKVYNQGGTLILHPIRSSSAIPVDKKFWMAAVIIPREGVRKIALPDEPDMKFDVKEIEVK